MARRDYSGNAVSTTLTAGIGPTDLSLSINDAAGWPSGGASGKFFVTIDRGESTEERILINSRTGTNLTIANVGDRGVDNTIPASHNPNASIEHTMTATDADEANAHLNDTSRDDHSQYLNAARHDVEARHQFGAALGTPGAPAAVGTVASPGDGDDPARENHVHIIGAGAINSSGQFAAGVIDAAAIAADAVGTSELAPDAVTATEIAANAVGTTELADDAVTAAKIAANAVGSSELADNAVDTAALADDAVTAAKLANNAVDNAAILDATITLAKIASQAFTSYVPTFGGLVGGSNTRTGRYFKVGRIVFGAAQFVIGAGGNVTGDITVSLPFAAASGTSVEYLLAARARTGASRATGIGLIVEGASEGINIATIGTDIWDGTNPFNWDVGDNFNSWFIYEAAA